MNFMTDHKSPQVSTSRTMDRVVFGVSMLITVGIVAYTIVCNMSNWSVI